ncbi:MAG: hypothetical protein IPO50_12770 [Sphingomonadales bacterium]|nr:hypothetical protein [Sphingomonadales bacterium]
MADKKSEIEGYQVGINEFGVGSKAHLVIYRRIGLEGLSNPEDNSDGYDLINRRNINLWKRI